LSRVRLVPIALIVVMSLAVLFGLWRLYLQFSLINPLVTKIVTVQGVASASVTSENPPEIQVKLKPNNDLQTTYLAIMSRISDAANANVKLNFVSSPSRSLWHVYEELEPIIDKGEAQGNYPEMIVAATKEARSLGASAVITVDVQRNVYVQIAQGKQTFYKVVEPH
jgi:hypothetical protein